jgi:hypothetical protein
MEAPVQWLHEPAALPTEVASVVAMVEYPGDVEGCDER